ncbi:MAG: type II secretion system F family protein, partial [Candidatus Andersenbacteria bacterium]|nr:type II secretion system F family protein [Candidatus Andersenbacteria bacterium]
MQYSYKAKTKDGKIKFGEINAKNRSDLIAKLNNDDLALVSVQESQKEEKKNFEISKILKRVSVIDKMLFTRHLGVMLRAGLSFSRATTVLAEQTENAYFKEILESVREDIQKGNQLATSLAKYPKVFDELFVNMIRVGEMGGNLEEVLDILYLQLKKEHELTSRVKGAMTYPAVIIFAMVVIGVLMMMFVVPSLLKIFTETGAELPASTKMIVFISDSFQNYGLLILAGFIVFIISFLKVIKTKAGKKKFDFVLLHLPAIGKIVSKINMARFSRTLSSMIASGVSIVKALDIISETLGNTYYQDSIKDACQEVQRGVSLSEVIRRYDKLYYPLMINMIEVGEETGTLQETLKQVSEFYEDEVEQVTANMSSIIEPVLMLVIGGAVGFFAVSMIQPMYSVMGTI